MSDTFTNQFGETITAKIEQGQLVFYHSDDLFDKRELPLRIEALLSGLMVINALNVFAIVDEQELEWMVRRYLEFKDQQAVQHE